MSTMFCELSPKLSLRSGANVVRVLGVLGGGAIGVPGDVVLL